MVLRKIVEVFDDGLIRQGQQQNPPVLVIRELDEVPLDPLVAVLLLLHLEHELVELLLQLLVRVVDQELLEVVVLERFEPELRTSTFMRSYRQVFTNKNIQHIPGT